MSRGVVLNLLASALTILAAITLLGSATLVDSAPLTALPEPQTATVVRAFTEAVSEALPSDDSAPIERIVTPDVEGIRADPKGGETIALGLASGEATVLPAGANTTLRAPGSELATVFAFTILPNHTVSGVQP